MPSLASPAPVVNKGGICGCDGLKRPRIAAMNITLLASERIAADCEYLLMCVPHHPFGHDAQDCQCLLAGLVV